VPKQHPPRVAPTIENRTVHPRRPGECVVGGDLHWPSIAKSYAVDISMISRLS